MSSTNTGGGSSPPPITLDYVFGLKGDVKNNVHFLDDVTVLYPAGYNMVIYNTEKKTQKFISLGSPDHVSSCDISSMALLNSATVPAYSHSSNTTHPALLAAAAKPTRLLAVAERGGKQPASVSVLNMHALRKRSRHVLSSPDVQSPEFVCISFSSDGKYLLALGGAPDWTLVHWQWEQGRVLQTARVSNASGAAITQVSHCPVDASVICVTGHGILRFLRCEEAELRAIPVRMAGVSGTQRYTCHCWIEERVLVATDTGDILLFEDAELVGALASAPGGGSIEVICPFSRGFVAGCDAGVLHIYTRDEQHYYTLAQSLQLENNLVKLRSVSVSPSEDRIVVTLENDQSFVITCALAAAGSAASSSTALLAADELSVAPLAQPCHFQAVLGLATCLRKPLLVTCGLDRSVRLWDYSTRQLRLLQFFSEQPLCVAMHPMGLQLVVGFSDGLRVFSVLLDKLKCVYQYPVKACREVQISRGGQYIAVANGSVVQIYSFYRCSLLGSFSLHRGRVKSLQWSADDSTLISAGADGYVYAFKVSCSTGSGPDAGDAGGDFALSCSYRLGRGHASCAIAAPEQRGLLFASGSDMRLHVLQDGECIAQQQHTVALNALAAVPKSALQQHGAATAAAVTQGGGVLFGGSDAGVLRCFTLPLSNYCFDVQCHAGPVSRVLVSPCGGYVFTAGDDGLVCSFAIGGARGAGADGRVAEHSGSGVGEGAARGGMGLGWSPDVLAESRDLAEQEHKLRELQRSVVLAQQDNEASLLRQREMHQERVAELQRKFSAEVAATVSGLRELDEQRRKRESWFAYRVEQVSQHRTEQLRAQDVLYADKVEAERQRCEETAALLLQEQEEAARDAEELARQGEEERLAVTASLQEQLTKEQEARLAVVKASETRAAEYGLLKHAIEEDVDEELDEIKATFDAKFLRERASTLRLRDLNTVRQQKFAELRAVVQRGLQELRGLKARQEEQCATVAELTQEIYMHARELQERESTMRDRQAWLAQLKRKSQELDKFKFVLDSKLQELHRQLLPRREQLSVLRVQVTQLQRELERYARASADLQLQAARGNQKLRGVLSQRDASMEQRRVLSARVQAFRLSIGEALGSAVQALARIGSEAATDGGASVGGGEVEAALSVVAEGAVQQQELSTAMRQVKRGLRLVYQQHVLGVHEPTLLQSAAHAHATNAHRLKQKKSGAIPAPVIPAAGAGAGVGAEKAEYERERGYLERCVDSLVNKGGKGAEMRAREKARLLRENVVLIEEVNALRRELQLSRRNQTGGQHVAAAGEGAGTSEEMRAVTALLATQREQMRALKNHLVSLQAQSQES